MNCETAQFLRSTNDPALEEHLRTCPECMIGANARYYNAPPGLEAKIRRTLRHEAAPSIPWRLMALAATVLLVASLAVNVRLMRSRGEATVMAVLSTHVESLTGTHLLDVESSDRHTVKPWFNGKVDFAPPVKFLDSFPLLGGRLDYIEGHPAAALVYGRSKHVINVFVWPEGSAGSDISTARNGYNMQTWWEAGMTFWAISDLNAAELSQFVTAFRRS